MLEKDDADIKAVQARIDSHLDALADANYERRIVKHCRRIINRRMGIKRPAILHSINMPQNAALDDLLDAANAAGYITDDQIYDLDDADLIVVGTGADGQTEYVVIEVSETIDDSDIDRAGGRAAALSSAADCPATAAVIGKAISAANRQRAEQSSVAVIIMAEQ